MRTDQHQNGSHRSTRNQKQTPVQYARSVPCRVVAEPLEGRQLFAVGGGLVANYYADANFQNLALARTDATVNFDWGTAAPAAGLPAEGFSVRWTGQVTAPAAGAYTLTADSAGGMRVTVGGQTVVDDWPPHARRSVRGTFTFAAGTYYDLKVEFRDPADAQGAATAKLLWSSASQTTQVVPQARLFRLGTGWVSAWSSLGLSGAAGSFTGSNDDFVLTSGVAPTQPTPGLTRDAGRFAYKAFRGDGEVVARLDSLSGGSDADLLFRGTLADNSPAVGLSVNGTTARLEWRAAAGAALQAGPAVSVAAGPVWLRLKRDGDVYAGYVSATDGAWRLVGTTTAVLDGGGGVRGMSIVRAGLAVAGPGAANRAAFSDVRVVSAPQLGGNLQRISDTSYDRPFVDLVKLNPGFKRLDGSSAPVDANGWPTVSDFQVWVAGNGNVPAGRYTITFTGPSGVRVTSLRGATTVFRSSYNATTRQHVWYADNPANQPNLGFKFQYTGSGLKDLRVLQPGYSHVNTPTYTTKYVNLLRSMNPASLRFMDWVQTNSSTVTDWGQRSTAGTANWARRGVSWEACIDLCNQLGTNLYVNVPGRASDDYVRRLADLVRTRLRPDLNVYVEQGNEQWIYASNWPNGVWNYHEALKEVQAAVRAGGQSPLNYDNRPVDPNQTTIDPLAPDTYAWALRRTARRGVQIADVFRQSWAAGGQADPINGRVRVVLAAQVNVSASYRIMAEYVDRFHAGARRHFWTTAGAIYTRMGPYQDHQVNGQWQTSNPAVTVDELLPEMIDSADRYPNERRFESARLLAEEFGLRLGEYEVGHDTFGPFNLGAKKLATLDPRFGQAVQRFLATFFAQGGSMTHFYALGSQSYDTAGGTWAISNNPNDWNTPRAQAFKNVRAGQLPNAFPGAGVYG